MRPYDREKNNLKMRKYRELHRKEYNEYQKIYKRKIRGSRLAIEGCGCSKSEKDTQGKKQGKQPRKRGAK